MEQKNYSTSENGILYYKLLVVVLTVLFVKQSMNLKLRRGGRGVSDLNRHNIPGMKKSLTRAEFCSTGAY